MIGVCRPLSFALILPLMFCLYAGCVDISQGVSIDRKVTVAARTIADLVAQVATTTSTDVNNVLDAAAKIMEPYPAAGVTVSLVKIDTKGVAKIVWSKSKNGGPPTEKDEVVTVDASLKTPNNETYLVWGRGKIYVQAYDRLRHRDSWSLNDQIFMRPRISASVDCTTC